MKRKTIQRHSLQPWLRVLPVWGIRLFIPVFMIPLVPIIVVSVALFKENDGIFPTMFEAWADLAELVVANYED